MSIASPGLRFGCGFATVLISLAGYALPTIAQSGTPSSVGVPPVKTGLPLDFEHSMVGVQFGVGQNMQQEAFTCPCGATFNNGKGMGWNAAAFFELPVTAYLFAGIKAGLDRMNTNSSYLASEIVTLETSSGQLDTVALILNRKGSLDLSLLSFEPFIQYQVFRSNFFVQLGAGISDLTRSNFSQTRTMTSRSATLSDGTTINNLTFTNGSNTEELQSGSLTGANSLLFSGILSVGYNFNARRMTLAPTVTYNYPFSSPQSGGIWKIASLYASVNVGYFLN